MTDYWLSKLFFDLQGPGGGARWRDDPEAVLADYPLRPEIREAVLNGDLGPLAPHVNAYLLRFFCSTAGMKDDEILAKLHALKPENSPARAANQGDTTNG